MSHTFLGPSSWSVSLEDSYLQTESRGRQSRDSIFNVKPVSMYRKSGYMKFSLEKIFVLKNFHRVNVLRKYFNMKILKSGRTYGTKLETCHGCVRCFCNGEVHSCKCERRTRARGMVRSIIRIVTIHCRKNSL